jgi:hypothetical protein
VFWTKKPAPKAAAPAPLPPIEFRASDDIITRAENIYRAIGFHNDRFGMVAQIAGYLSMYADWDRKATLGRCFECGQPLSVFCPSCNHPKSTT